MTLTLVDIAFFCILAFSIYFGHKTLFIKESIKLVGTWLATFIALHYYITVSEILKHNHYFSEPAPELLAYILLTVIIVYIFLLIGDGWYVMLKFELPARLERLGGLAVSIIRTYLVFGLIFVALLISGGQLAKEARHSLSRLIVGFISVGIYQNFYNDIVVKIVPQEPLNQKVIDMVFEEDEGLVKSKTKDAL
jgi:uncharacterized membrane protein required for colicin V production